MRIGTIILTLVFTSGLVSTQTIYQVPSLVVPGQIDPHDVQQTSVDDVTKGKETNATETENSDKCRRYDVKGEKYDFKMLVEEIVYEGGLLPATCEVIGSEPFDQRPTIDLPPEDKLIFRKIYPVWEPIQVTTKSSEGPLILTPYIESGKLEEGRNLALVKHPDIQKLVKKSYSGYFTVDEKYDSNLFFWFFPAQVENLTKY